MSKFNLRGFWMVVFHFLVVPNIVCRHTFSRIYLGISFLSTHEVMNIVRAILSDSASSAPRFWMEDLCEAPRTGKFLLVKPIHGKVSCQSVWGVTARKIGAATPMHPALAIVVTPPDGEPLNRVEAEKHISYALTASSVVPLQDRACTLELMEFAPETLAHDLLPTGVMGLCGSSPTIASRCIGPSMLKNNLPRAPMWRPSIGSRVWLKLPVWFRRRMISFPLPRIH